MLREEHRAEAAAFLGREIESLSTIADPTFRELHAAFLRAAREHIMGDCNDRPLIEAALRVRQPHHFGTPTEARINTWLADLKTETPPAEPMPKPETGHAHAEEPAKGQ
jgi:hypothetical protein